jgi:hypothetical protein
MLNEGNQIHNFISSSDSVRLFNELRFRFHRAKSYGFYGSGSGSTTLKRGIACYLLPVPYIRSRLHCSKIILEDVGNIFSAEKKCKPFFCR